MFGMRKKALYILIAATLMLSLCACSAKPDSPIEGAFESYIKLVRKQAESDPLRAGVLRFTLAYINDDEVPELVLADGDDHTGSVKIYFYDYDEDETVDSGAALGDRGGFAYYPGRSTVYDALYGNGGYVASRFYTFGKDFKASGSSTFTMAIDTYEQTHYFIDKDECAYSKYMETYNNEAPALSIIDQELISYEAMTGTYESVRGDGAKDKFETMFEVLKTKTVK